MERKSRPRTGNGHRRNQTVGNPRTPQGSSRPLSGTASRKSVFSFSKYKRNRGPPSTGGPQRALSVRSLKHVVHDINDAYKAPKTANYTEQIHTYFGQGPKVNCFTEHAHHKRGIPPPNKYQRPLNWKTQNQGDNRQKFLGAKRITEVDKILATKKLRLPGPASYKVKDGYKVPNGGVKQKQPQLAMYDNQVWYSKQVPSYVHKVKYDMITPHSPAAKLRQDIEHNGKQVLSPRTLLCSPRIER